MTDVQSTDGAGGLKPLPTLYAGVKFRSRLEARWAVFFDDLGLPWDYEHEGFELPSGNYLPDFWLRTIDTFFEVKPDNYEGEDARWSDLVEASGHRLILATGMPAHPDDRAPGYHGWMQVYEIMGDEHKCNWDSHRQFCICPTCGKIGLEFDGRDGRICRHPGYDEGGHNYHPRVIAAYSAARGYRFWNPK